jgi:hypothetical protein
MGMREQIAKAILGGKVGGPTPTGIHVYHSSPHDFDKFDLSKLRSGEGANIYGSGFYFAENPKVSGRGGEYWSTFTDRFPREEGLAAEYLADAGFDRAAAIAKIRKEIPQIETPQLVERTKQALGLLESDRSLIGPRTYEVNIKAQPEQLLNLDTGIGGQSPYVTERLKALGIEHQPVSLENTKRLSYDLLNDLRKVKGAAPWVGEDINMTAERIKQAHDPYSVWQHMRDIPAGYGIPQRVGLGDKPTMWDAVAPRIHSKLNSIKASMSEMPTQMRIEEAFGSNPVRVADALRDVEIPGSSYRDQGSRMGSGATQMLAIHGTPDKAVAAAQKAMAEGVTGNPTYWNEVIKQIQTPPTHNYVVNDPNKLDIMAKYGIVGGAPVMGALAAGDQYQ